MKTTTITTTTTNEGSASAYHCNNVSYVYDHILKSTIELLLSTTTTKDHNNDKNDDGSSSLNFSVDAVQQCIMLCMFSVIITFVISTMTKNYSQVDKIWSIIPVVYTWICVCDERTFLMAIMVTIWGVRLTWNFHRRGGYKWPPWDGDEDYRWKYIQGGYFVPILTNKYVWSIFNFGFISLYQNILLLLMVSPSVIANVVATNIHCSSSSQSTTLNRCDIIATLLMLGFIIIESIADNQQYNFQTEKYRLRRNNNSGRQKLMTGEYADGFLNQSGLFRFVRKPNYAAEQAIWISFYVYSIAAFEGTKFVNCSIVGCLLLIGLFAMSGWFTEKITLSKYPTKYNDYIQRVPLYIPKYFNPLFLFFNNQRRRKSKKSREMKSL